MSEPVDFTPLAAWMRQCFEIINQSIAALAVEVHELRGEIVASKRAADDSKPVDA